MEKIDETYARCIFSHNYVRALYLQNLRQGFKSIDDYTQEFYHLVASNDLGKTEDQKVARYIGKLRQQF